MQHRRRRPELPPGFRRVRIYEPAPPSDPQQSPLIMALLAIIDAQLDYPSITMGMQHWEAVVGGEAVVEPSGALATFESAWLTIQDRMAGRLGPAHGLEMPEELRRLFALEPGEALNAILGFADASGEFQGGLAGLTAPQAEVVRLMLSGWVSWDIQRSWEEVRGHLARKRKGQPSVETIERYGREGWRRVRALFGQVGEAA